MPASMNKNGVFNASPIEGWNTASVLMDDMIVGKNWLRDSESPSFSAYADATINKTDDVVVSEWGTDKAVRYTGTSGTNRILTTKRPGGTPSAIGITNPYVINSFYIKNNGTNNIEITNNANSSVVIPPGFSGFKYIVREVALNPNQNFQINIMTPAAGDPFDFTIWHVKFEEGNVPTPWIPHVDDGYGDASTVYTNPIKANEIYEY